jgi:hypothetical protein
MIWVGVVARMGEKEMHTGLVGKPERRKPVGKPRSRWVYTTKVVLKWAGRTWTGLFWLYIRCFHVGFIEDLRVLRRNIVSLR